MFSENQIHMSLNGIFHNFLVKLTLCSYLLEVVFPKPLLNFANLTMKLAFYEITRSKYLLKRVSKSNVSLKPIIKVRPLIEIISLM